MPKDNDAYVYVTYIRTTPEKLWDALTNPEFTKQYWFDIEVQSDWKVGSPMVYSQKGRIRVDGEVLAAKRPTLLAYTFHETEGASSKEPPTKVTLEIERQGQGDYVKLTVTHTAFVPNSLHKPSISQGWPAVLSGLKSLLETGKTLDFTGFTD